MIGSAALLVGLLLILTWLAAARIPADASVASSGILAQLHVTAPGSAGRRTVWHPVRAFLLSPVHPATWRATLAICAGLFVAILAFAIIASLLSAGASTLLAGIGVAFFAFAIEGSRFVASVERRRASAGEPESLRPHAYRRLTGPWRTLVAAEFADESRWRDVLYVAVNLPLAIVEFAVAIGTWSLALALVTTPIWYDLAGNTGLPWFLGWAAGHAPIAVLARLGAGVALVAVAASLAQLVMALHRAVVVGLLCTSESGELRRQVETLRESRSAAIDAEASELRRIERDLHDGAQQRLVMLSIDLGLAGERMDENPEEAKRLLGEGREQARLALAEIRNLVRGMAPAILLDRGLVAALASIAASGPVPATVDTDLPPGVRLPDAVERAAYFVASEALANVAKHSGASRCTVRCRRSGSSLRVEVEDDGAGGAVVTPGGGLAGLAGRVQAVDGTLEISSPPGGPTVVRALIPVPAWAPGSAATPSPG